MLSSLEVNSTTLPYKSDSLVYSVASLDAFYTSSEDEGCSDLKDTPSSATELFANVPLPYDVLHHWLDGSVPLHP